jgi:hypothetical protein
MKNALFILLSLGSLFAGGCAVMSRQIEGASPSVNLTIFRENVEILGDVRSDATVISLFEVVRVSPFLYFKGQTGSINSTMNPSILNFLDMPYTAASIARYKALGQYPTADTILFPSVELSSQDFFLFQITKATVKGKAVKLK